MTDKYKDLRDALAAGPTPGPWTQGKTKEGRSCIWLGGKTEPLNDMGADSSWIDCNTEANARLIAAAHPETIRALLAERDALRDALAAAVDCGMVPKSSASDGGASARVRQVIVADMIRAALAQHQGEKHGDQ